MYTVTRVAGDSAHQWLPVRGLGMNTGIDDAFSLTWKTAAVLKGYGGPYLLHSYEVECKPACDAILPHVLLLAITVGIGSIKIQKLNLLSFKSTYLFHLA